VCFDFRYNFFLTFVILRRTKLYIIKNVDSPSCKVPACPILMKLCLFKHIFDKHSNIKFNENPPCGSRVVRCGEMDSRTDGRSDMTKLGVAFRIL
jgi:hypothetical protein